MRDIGGGDPAWRLDRFPTGFGQGMESRHVYGVGRSLLGAGKRVSRLGMLALIGLSASSVVPASRADTRDIEPSAYRSALTEALGDERAAFSAFAATTSFARAAGLDLIAGAPDSENARVQARAMVDALGSQDAHATSVAIGMQEEMTIQAAMTLGGAISDETLARIEVGARDEEWYCLTEALYFEARGESRAGQMAVAEVILNRVDSPGYPDTICETVKQGTNSGRRGRCQFSFQCDGLTERIGNKEVFEKLGKLAWVMMQGKPRTLTGKALFYHATWVRPRWSKKFVRTARIGDHIFYRPAIELTQN